MIGQTISHYKILDKLGEGGMGVVYKAEDTKLDRFVALKFLPPHLSSSEEEKQRFIHEAKAASALDHPNICTIYEIDETADGQMFIAMACYDGESLKQRIERGPLPIDQTIEIAIQIAEGLANAHSKEIVHPNHVKINDELDRLFNEAQAVALDLKADTRSILSAKAVKQGLTGQNVGDFFSYADKHIRNLDAEGRFWEWKKARVLVSKLRDFRFW